MASHRPICANPEKRSRCQPRLGYNCRWMPRFKYLDTLVLVFVVVLLVSNLVAQKVCRLGPLTISGAELLFPITYIFGDIFTEVYGYRASRRAIWIGFFASALLSAAGAMAVALPADPGWHNQQAFETVFGVVPRFVAASLIAYWVGEFANAFTLAQLKVLTRRKMALDPHHRVHRRRSGMRYLSGHAHLLRRASLPAYPDPAHALVIPHQSGL